MVRKINWDRQFGRRLKLRDLHVFFTVVQAGSMAKAAEQLGVAQPTVSETIADLEDSYGVRLFDRSPRGVEPTIYGAALHRRCVAAFDELKQSGRDIEYLADPKVGDLWIGCQEFSSCRDIAADHQALFQGLSSGHAACRRCAISGGAVGGIAQSQVRFCVGANCAAVDQGGGRTRGNPLPRPSGHRRRCAQQAGAPPKDRSCRTSRRTLDTHTRG